MKNDILRTDKKGKKDTRSPTRAKPKHITIPSAVKLYTHPHTSKGQMSYLNQSPKHTGSYQRRPSLQQNANTSPNTTVLGQTILCLNHGHILP